MNLARPTGANAVFDLLPIFMVLLRGMAL